MKIVLKIILPLLAGLSLLLSCNTEQTKAKSSQLEGAFTHTVYFWLKEPDNQESRKAFINSLKKFTSTSKHILSVQIGTPADTNRDVIDNTYTFSLIVTFTSAEEQENYQNEKGHLTFIEESNNLWEKVLVYDSIPI